MDNIFSLILAPLVVAILAMVIEHWIILPLRERQRDNSGRSTSSSGKRQRPLISIWTVLLFLVLFSCWYSVRWLLNPSEDLRSAGVVVATRVVPIDQSRNPILATNQTHSNTLQNNATELISFTPQDDGIVLASLKYINGACFNFDLNNANGDRLLSGNLAVDGKEQTILFAAKADQLYWFIVQVCGETGGSYSLELRSQP